MDRITMRADAYQELVRTGVRCGRLQSTNGLQTGWTLQCFIMSDIDRDTAKEAVKRYCRDQWEAQNFSFFTKYGAKKGEFWVRFTSWAL